MIINYCSLIPTQQSGSSGKHLFREIVIFLLKKSTPNLIIYGELGTYPMSVYIKLGMVNYWSRLINGKDSKLSLILYKFLHIKN